MTLTGLPSTLNFTSALPRKLLISGVFPREERRELRFPVKTRSLLTKVDCTGKLGMIGLRAMVPTWAMVVKIPLPTSMLALMGLPLTINCALPLTLRRLIFNCPP